MPGGPQIVRAACLGLLLLATLVGGENDENYFTTNLCSGRIGFLAVCATSGCDSDPNGDELDAAPLLGAMPRLRGLLPGLEVAADSRSLEASWSGLERPSGALELEGNQGMPLLREAIRQHFGAGWETAYCVAEKESGLNPHAVGAQGELGLFQLHPAGWLPGYYAWSEVDDVTDVADTTAYVAGRVATEGWGAFTTAGGCE